MQFIPFGYNHGDDDEVWEEPVRLLKVFAIFVTIVTIIWGLGAIVLAVKDPIPRWGMVNQDD
jgi:hypothetical protein